MLLLHGVQRLDMDALLFPYLQHLSGKCLTSLLLLLINMDIVDILQDVNRLILLYQLHVGVYLGDLLPDLLLLVLLLNLGELPLELVQLSLLLVFELLNLLQVVGINLGLLGLTLFGALVLEFLLGLILLCLLFRLELLLLSLLLLL